MHKVVRKHQVSQIRYRELSPAAPPQLNTGVRPGPMTTTSSQLLQIGGDECR